MIGAALVACGDDDGGADVGTDAGTDAPMVDAPTVDAPMVDAPTVDAPTVDAPSDAPMVDAPADAPADAPTDVPTDAGTDAPVDAGADVFDAGTDAFDGGSDPCTPNPCFMGATCTDVGGAASCAPCPTGMSGDGVSCTDFAGLVINEVDYDQPGADGDEFIELLNTSAAAIDLRGLTLYLVNGSGMTDYDEYSLDGATTSLAAGGRIVVGSASVLATLPVGVATITLGGAVQNGAPDGIAIVKPATSELVDALSYEGSIGAAMLDALGPFDLVEGTAATESDSSSVDGAMIRVPDGNDTDNASNDWAFSTLPTAGTVNLYCPPENALPGPRSLVFSAVDTDGDVVVVTNTTASDVDLTGWWWCERPAYALVPAGTTVPAGGSVTFFLTSSGANTPTEIYLNDARLDLDPAGDEIALYNTNSFGSSAAIEAFVAFGAAPATPTRQSFAVMAGLWSTGDFIPLTGGNTAMIALGTVTSSANWVDVDGACVP